MPEIKIDTGEGVFDPDSGYRSDHEVTCMEHPLHHSEGTFHPGSRSTNGPVPPDFLDRERVAANRAMHGLIHGCPGFHAEIPFITIDRLPFPGEIDSAIMQRRCRCLDPADELAILIHEDVEFVAELRLLHHIPDAVLSVEEFSEGISSVEDLRGRRLERAGMSAC